MSSARYQYKTIDIKDAIAYKQAESLINKGWKVYHIGISSILLEKKK